MKRDSAGASDTFGKGLDTLSGEMHSRTEGMRGQRRLERWNGSSRVLSTGIVGASLVLLLLWAGNVSAGDENSGSTRQPGPSDGLAAAYAVFQAIFKDIYPDLKLREVRQAALATIGATRGPDPDAEVTFPGAIGTAPQAVDTSRLLQLRWNGGAPPFHIELAEASVGHRLIETSERDGRLDLRAYPLGAYILTIAGKKNVRLSLPLSLVAPADVPLAPGIDAVQDPEVRELVEAVWLLTRAPITWRLEALSRLELLAKDKNNIVAQAIIEPAPSPDGEQDR
jgi:hypothetical protein